MTATRPPIYKGESCRMSRHHCHSARRESRPSNCALSNNERHPTARTLPQYIRAEVVECRVVIVTVPVANRGRATARSQTTSSTRLPERSTPLTYIPLFQHIAEWLQTLRCFQKRASPPPPTKRTSSRVAFSPPEAVASPPKASASPPKLESDDV